MTNQLLNENKGEISTQTIPFMYVEWEVLDLLFIPLGMKQKIHSPTFYFKDAIWYFRVIIHAANPRVCGWTYEPIDLYLMKKDPTTSKLRVTYHIGIKTVDGNTSWSDRGESMSSFERDLDCWGIFRQLMRSDLSDEKIRLDSNGVVIFFCYFWVETIGNLDAVSRTRLFESQSKKIIRQLVTENAGEISTRIVPVSYVEWKVPDILSLPKNAKHRIHSPSLQFKDEIWYLQATINDTEFRRCGACGPIDLHLVKKDCATPTVYIDYKIGLKRVDGNAYVIQRGERVFGRSVDCQVWTKLLSRLDLFHQKSTLAPNNIVTFFCYFRFESTVSLNAHSKMKISEGNDVSESFEFTSSQTTTTTTVTTTNEFSFCTCPGVPQYSVIVNGSTLKAEMKNSRKGGEDSGSSLPLQCNFAQESTPLPDSSPTTLSWTPEKTKFSSGNISEKPTAVFTSAMASPAIFTSCEQPKKPLLTGTSKLIKDFQNLFQSGEDSDLTIKVKDMEFRVHKSILRARSSAFLSMLSHDMVKKSNRTVHVMDCNPEAFKIFLLYLYNGCVEDLSEDIVFDLYRSADKYDAEELKVMCRKFMVSNLSVDTVCDIIDHARQYKDWKLLRTASKFFTKNFKDIILTVKWQFFLKKNIVAANELIIKASHYYEFCKQ